MPEGDSVYRLCADLHDALVGHELRRVDLRVPRLANAGALLEGALVDAIVPHGKHLLMRIGDHTLHSHLGMDGAWRILTSDARWPAPTHHVRAVLETDDRLVIGTLLPVLELLPRDHEHDATGHLGPDLLDRGWNDTLAARAVANLRAEPDRELASALLDQRVLAGLGNIYVTELCFLRGVRPTATVAEAGDLEALVALARRLLYANRMHPGRRVFTGMDRAGARTWVYGRERLPCRRCGGSLETGQHGGDPETADEWGARSPSARPPDDRSRRSIWCPSCQPAPALD